MKLLPHHWLAFLKKSTQRRSPRSRKVPLRLQVECLEARDLPASFYWQLATPVTVDPAGLQALDTYSNSGADFTNGTYVDNSSLTITSGPDQATYSDVCTDTQNPSNYFNFSAMVTLGWSGAPAQTILPGQTVTLSANATGTFGGNFSSATYGASTSLGEEFASVPNVFTPFSPISTSGSSSYMDLPGPSAQTQNDTETFAAPTSALAGQSLVIQESAEINGPIGHSFSTSGVCIEYVYNLVQGTAPPATVTWSGLGKTNAGKPDPNWSNQNNWVGNVAPTSGAALVFPSSAANYNSVDNMPSFVASSIEVDSTYNFSGDLLCVADSMTFTAGNTDVAMPLNLEQGTVPAVAAAPLPAAAPPPAPGSPVTIDVIAGDTKFQVLQGNEGFIKQGPGELFVNRMPSYTGSFELQNGTLDLTSADAANLKTATFIVNTTTNTATLELAQAMTLSDAVNLQSGDLIVQGSNLTLTGTITVNAATEIDPAHGTTLTLNGTLTSPPDAQLTLGGTGTVTIGGQFNGTGDLLINGCTLTAGVVATSYAGIVTLQAGALTLSSPSAATPTPLRNATLVVNVPAGNTATLTASGANATPNLPGGLTFQGGTLNVFGTLDVDGPTTVAQNTTLVCGSPTGSKGGGMNFGNGTPSNGGLTGAGMLTVQGQGGIAVNEAFSGNVTVGPGAVTAYPCKVIFDGHASGNGSITVNGGWLFSVNPANFAGNIYLQAGAVLTGEVLIAGILVGPGGMGTATLTVQPSGTNVVTLAATAGTTLTNTVILQGGTLEVKSIGTGLTLDGPVMVQNSSNGPTTAEIDATQGTDLTFGSHGAISGSGSTLTLGGAGGIHLAGALTTAVTVTGNVLLEATFNGTGPLQLNSGAHLYSLGVGAYTGKVTLQGGTVTVSGNNPLGTPSELDMGPGTVSWQIIGSVDLGNAPVMLNGGTVNVASLTSSAKPPGLYVDGPATVTSSTEIDSFGNKAFLRFTNTVGGSAALTIGGLAAMTGALSVPVTIVNPGQLALGVGFQGNAALTVNGGVLSSGASLGALYTGTITLNAGQIFVVANDDLGNGNLNVAVTAGKTAKLSAASGDTLTNPVAMSGGALNTAGNFTFMGVVTLNGGNLATQGNPTFAGAVVLNNGTLSTNGQVTFNDALSLLGGNLSTQGKTTFAGPVTINQGTLSSHAGATLLFNGTLDMFGGNVSTDGTTTFTGQVTLNGGTIAPSGTSGTFTFNGPVAFNGGNLAVSGTYTFNGPVTFQTGSLSLAGQDVFNGVITLTQPTTLTVLHGSKVRMPGGFAGGQSLQLNADTGATLSVTLHSNIGSTSLIAGPGTKIYEQATFPSSEYSQVTGVPGGQIWRNGVLIYP